MSRRNSRIRVNNYHSEAARTRHWCRRPPGSQMPECGKRICSKTTITSKGEYQQRTYEWDSIRCLPARLHTCYFYNKGHHDPGWQNRED